MDNNNTQNTSLSRKKMISLILVITLIIIGIYLYIFYINSDRGIAVINPELDNVNILLLGIDDNDRGTANLDSIVFIELQTKEKRLVFQMIPPDIKADSETFRELDVDIIMDKITLVTETKPDYYFTISYQGFKKIIDELSGIEITLDQSIEVPEFGLYLKKGSNLLSGKEALNYTRWCNYNSDSSNRVYRQEKVIKGIVDKLLQANTLLNISGLYNTIVETYRGVETNLDKELVVQIIKLIKNSDIWKVEYKVM